MKVKIEVKKFFAEGHAGYGIPNARGWKLVASSATFTITHILASRDDAKYLFRGFDGRSASTVIYRKSEYPPKPTLTEKQCQALRDLLETCEENVELFRPTAAFGGRWYSSLKSLRFSLALSSARRGEALLDAIGKAIRKF